MQALAGDTLTLIRRAAFEEADREFERLLAESGRDHGVESLEIADLIMSYGMILFHEAKEPANREHGLAAIRRAIDAYKRVLGPSHPEVALSLSDYANGWLALKPEDPPLEADAALEESYKIRLAMLGPRNLETASALLALGRVKGLASRTGAERSRVEAAARMIEQSVQDFGLNRVQPDLSGSITARFELAVIYLKNGLAVKALQVAAEAYEDYKRNFAGDKDMCRVVVSRAGILARKLLAAGNAGLAATLEQSRAGLDCLARTP